MRLRDAEEIEYEMLEEFQPNAEGVIGKTKVRVQGTTHPEPKGLKVKAEEDNKENGMIILEVYPPKANPFGKIYAEGLNSGESFEAKPEYVRFDEEIEDSEIGDIFSSLKVYWDSE